MNPPHGQPTGNAIYLDDLSSFVGSGQAQREEQPGHWRLQKNCWGARNGELLVSGPETNAPTLSFAPEAAGPHAIFVGAYSRGNPGGFGERNYGIYVRFDDEPHFTYLQLQRKEPSYQEMFFKVADLTGRKIEIANFEMTSSLDYLKLVPVEPPSLPEATGKLIGILDFADDANTSEPPMFEAGSAVRRHAEAGYDVILWKAYAVRCEYHTKVGEQRSYSYSDAEIMERPADDPVDDERSKRGVGGLLLQYDTMRQAVEEAKKVGLSIYGWARISNEFSKMNHQFSATTPFHLAHPEARQIYKGGSPAPRLSFAFPEVRQHKVDILCEIASYGMDGICIDVLRHPLMAQYDQPLVDSFKEKTGRDPHEEENDVGEDWLRFRSEPFTQFLREARAALDRQEGRRYPLMVRTVDQPWRNLHIGCDVETWVAEGIVDEIIFGPHCATADNYPETLDIDSYLKLCAGKVKVYGQVWRYGSGLHAEVMARELYEQGADGVAFYESNMSVYLPTIRDRLWKFSRPETLGR